MSKYKCGNCGNSTYDWEHTCGKCDATFINNDRKSLFSFLLFIVTFVSLIFIGFQIFDYFDLKTSVPLFISFFSFLVLILTGFIKLTDHKDFDKFYKKFVQLMYRDKINWQDRSYITGTSSFYLSLSSKKSDCECSSSNSLLPFGIGLLFGIGIS